MKNWEKTFRKLLIEGYLMNKSRFQKTVNKFYKAGLVAFIYYYYLGIYC